MPESNEGIESNENTVREIILDTSKLEEQGEQILDKASRINDTTFSIFEGQGKQGETLTSIQESNDSLKNDFQKYLEIVEEQKILREEEKALEEEQKPIIEEQIQKEKDLESERWENLESNLLEISEKIEETNSIFDSFSTHELETSLSQVEQTLDTFNDLYDTAHVGMGLILGCIVALAFVKGVQP